MSYTKWKVQKCDEANAEVVFDDPEPYIKIYTPYGDAEAIANLIAEAPRMARFLENLCAEWEDYGGIDETFYQDAKEILSEAKRGS